MYTWPRVGPFPGNPIPLPDPIERDKREVAIYKQHTHPFFDFICAIGPVLVRVGPFLGTPLPLPFPTKNDKREVAIYI